MYRSSSIEWSGSGPDTAYGSRNVVAASSKETPCFRRLASAFFGSQVNLMDYECLACCRCDHASSSSGRFQSSASTASLSSALSDTLVTGRSSMIITSAHRAAERWTGSSSHTLPCSSIIASTVRIIIVHSLQKAYMNPAIPVQRNGVFCAPPVTALRSPWSPFPVRFCLSRWAALVTQ